MIMRNLLSICVVLIFSVTATASIYIEVIPSDKVPNGLGSPSWSGYLANALNSIENRLGDIGGDGPTGYHVASEVTPGAFTVSGFNSWMGQADPPSPFHNEHGNRLHFGVHVIGDGEEQFTLHDLSVEIVSSDEANGLGLSFDFAGQNFTAARKGINWGADRKKGGGDDIVYLSGPGNVALDEFVYVGVGQAFDATFEPGSTNQDKLDSVFTYCVEADLKTVGATWFVGAESSYASVNVNLSRAGSSVPEPAILGLLPLLGLLRRR